MKQQECEHFITERCYNLTNSSIHNENKDNNF